MHVALSVDTAPGLVELPMTWSANEVPEPEGKPHGAVAGQPRWFGPPGRPLFGWLHGVAAPGAPAVVVCPPLGRELGAGHRALRHLAEELAANGMLAVRFDYDGTGDSAGSDADPGRVQAWLDSVAEAVALARSEGAGPVALVGLRAGALLAEVAARRLGGVDALVLWDPFASGKALVRHLRALQVLEAATVPGRAGSHELLGFQLGPADVAALAALSASPEDGPAARRVLVLHRPNDPGLGRLLARLGEAATAVPTDDHDRFLDAPSTYRAIPEATLAAAADWLVDVLGPTTRHRVPAGPGQPTGWGSAAVVGGGPGGAVRERPVRLGPAGLFAVETLPERVDPARPVILMVNAATDHHVGPNRLWVHLARRWAPLGFRSIRLDLSGIGDSPTRTGRPEHVIRSPDAFDDLRDVARAVSPDDPGNVVLVGLCSGAYQALESALDLRARGVLAVNPAPVFSPPELQAGGPVDPRRRICRPSPTVGPTYRRVVPHSLRRRLQPLMWRLFSLLHPRRTPGRWLGELVEAGVDTYVVCGEAESHQLLEGGRQAQERLEATGLLRIEVVERLNPGLLPAAQREDVAERFTARLVERHGGAQGRSTAGR